MRSSFLRPALVLLAGLAVIGAAMAQEAPKAKAKAKAAPKSASLVIVENRRNVDLTAFSIVNPAGKAMVTMRKPLAAGKKISMKLPPKAGCVFAVNAGFADDAEFDQSEVNLCTDKTVRLID